MVWKWKITQEIADLNKKCISNKDIVVINRIFTFGDELYNSLFNRRGLFFVGRNLNNYINKEDCISAL